MDHCPDGRLVAGLSYERGPSARPGGTYHRAGAAYLRSQVSGERRPAAREGIDPPRPQRDGCGRLMQRKRKGGEGLTRPRRPFDSSTFDTTPRTTKELHP